MASNKISFNPDDLTLDDMEDFENWTGMSFDEAFAPRNVMGPDNKVLKDEKGRPVKTVKVSAKALKAIVTIVKRKEDPEFSYADAGKVKITEIDIESDDDRPEEPSVASAS